MRGNGWNVMKQCWNVCYIIIQCTWGILQTFAGFLLFTLYRRCPHEFCCGAVKTRWPRKSGISLGMFIFTPNEEPKAGETGAERLSDLTVHEYGHTIQSLILGPCYLLLIGLPSAIWANAGWCIRWRREKKVPYNSFCVERWADQLGGAVLVFLHENRDICRK